MNERELLFNLSGGHNFLIRETSIQANFLSLLFIYSFFPKI